MTHPLLDQVLTMWRNEYVWIPLYIFIVSFVILNFKKRAYWYLFFMVLTFAMTDIVSSSIIKPMIERYRPCHDEFGVGDVRELVECGSGYSFTSSHATNHFGIAFFIIFTFGRSRRLLSFAFFVWAAIVAYAQVYVGVHYPLDVISGALLGISIALLTTELYIYSMKRLEIKLE